MKKPSATVPILRLGLLLLAAAMAQACEPVREDVEEALEEAEEDLDDDDAGQQASDFSAVLRGENERPNPVPTTMSGDAQFTVADDASSVDYTVNVEEGDNVTAAHIHIGSRDVAGPIVVTLFSDLDEPVDVDGELSSGTFTEEDLEGPMAEDTLEDLLDEIRAGNAYVNVHTVQYPDGEVRGQIEEE